MTPLLAEAGYGLQAGASGPAWWQTLGGLLAVFGLLVLGLRLLARFNKRGGFGHAALVAVWHLGPRREIQVLRLADDVHYVYRHEGAMVLLKQESFDQWERTRAAGESAAPQPGRPDPGGRRFDLRALPALLRPAPDARGR
ncbi:MAG TPA: hypothetical protein PLQ13_10145 [Candidatus Krumholzibacteria bacterium]|nr:hypothetical protein [Candidatus Krumholzibacteria bacterium]